MADRIPDDVIIKILERVTIKSLIRFTCVSKRWRSIILFDQQFARSQFQIGCDQQSRTRLLLSTATSGSEFESLDSEAPLYPNTMSSSSVIKLSCPFKQPNDVVNILSSCNGLVFVTSHHTNREQFTALDLYIWNPSTGFFKKLPDSLDTRSLINFGFGYLSSTDDYKVIVNINGFNSIKRGEAEIFSWRANTWKTIQVPSDHYFMEEGLLLNEALHWLSCKQGAYNIIAFDLAEEECRSIPLPTTLKYTRDPCSCSFRGTLCVFDCAYNGTSGSIDLWIMREYDVDDSWAKLFTVSVPILHGNAFRTLMPILVTETSTLLKAHMRFPFTDRAETRLIRSGHHQEVKFLYFSEDGQEVMFETIIKNRLWNITIFQESLLWLH